MLYPLEAGALWVIEEKNLHKSRNLYKCLSKSLDWDELGTFLFLIYFLIGRKKIYSVVLLSSVWQCESVIIIYRDGNISILKIFKFSLPAVLWRWEPAHSSGRSWSRINKWRLWSHPGCLLVVCRYKRNDTSVNVYVTTIIY